MPILIADEELRDSNEPSKTSTKNKKNVSPLRNTASAASGNKSASRTTMHKHENEVRSDTPVSISDDSSSKANLKAVSPPQVISPNATATPKLMGDHTIHFSLDKHR